MTVHNFRLMAVSAVCAALAMSARSEQICNLVFGKCPSNFASATINVPQNVIWLDPVIPVCAENIQVQTGTNSAPPSIVFIIDNSGSMSDGDVDNSTGNDPEEARFKVVKQLLDTIAKTSPKAQVGLSIFSRRLQFDDRDNPYFKPAFPADPTQHDAYVPLTSLDTTFAGGMKGLDTLKNLLNYTGNGNLLAGTKQPSSRVNNGVEPTNIRSGTDITLGFEAAIQAMKASTAATSNQFFIFLSDGEPSSIDQGRTNLENAFQQGVGAPTTFTIFFKQTANPTAPNSIVTMTNNIRNNGYSATNPQSAYWAINTPNSQLLSLLQTSVLNPIFANTPGKPLTAVMDLGGTKYNSTAVNATNFTFPQRVPIGANQTAVNLTYTYQYTDSGKTKTKEVPYVLNLNRTNTTAPLADGLTTACQEQGSITLFNKGNPINIVTADHNDLDIHLTLASGETCNGCKVEVKPSKSADKENVTLNPSTGFQTGNFGRETINTPAVGDGKLQHLPTDSVIVTYVNPENPLDVIRKAFPYSDVSTVLTVIRHNDYARAGDAVPSKPGEHFILVTPGAVVPTAQDAVKNWSVVNTLATDKDSLRYVGDIIQASRAFKVEIQIYTNLGQFVNKIGFTISQAEFAKLSKSPKGNTRQLKVLWDSRTSEGNLAGTGAYILKSTVTLLRLPGVAEDEASTTDYRVVGVLRDQ
jgi:hypothetical protein